METEAVDLEVAGSWTNSLRASDAERPSSKKWVMRQRPHTAPSSRTDLECISLELEWNRATTWDVEQTLKDIKEGPSGSACSLLERVKGRRRMDCGAAHNEQRADSATSRLILGSRLKASSGSLSPVTRPRSAGAGTQLQRSPAKPSKVSNILRASDLLGNFHRRCVLAVLDSHKKAAQDAAAAPDDFGPKLSQLRVTIISVAGLSPGTSELFVAAGPMSQAVSEWCATADMRRTQMVTWNETFEISPFTDRDTLGVKLFDRDFGPDRLIGEAVLPKESLLGPFDGRIELNCRSMAFLRRRYMRSKSPSKLRLIGSKDSAKAVSKESSEPSPLSIHVHVVPLDQRGEVIGGIEEEKAISLLVSPPSSPLSIKPKMNRVLGFENSRRRSSTTSAGTSLNLDLLDITGSTPAVPIFRGGTGRLSQTSEVKSLSVRQRRVSLVTSSVPSRLRWSPSIA